MQTNEIAVFADAIAKQVIRQAAESPKLDTSAVAGATEGSLVKTTVLTKDELVKHTTDVVMNQLNQEPWYKSRILVTQYVMVIVTIASALGYVVTPEYKEQIITTVLVLGGLVAPALTIWARLKAAATLHWPWSRAS